MCHAEEALWVRVYYNMEKENIGYLPLSRSPRVLATLPPHSGLEKLDKKSPSDQGTDSGQSARGDELLGDREVFIYNTIVFHFEEARRKVVGG